MYIDTDIDIDIDIDTQIFKLIRGPQYIQPQICVGVGAISSSTQFSGAEDAWVCTRSLTYHAIARGSYLTLSWSQAPTYRPRQERMRLLAT